MTLKKKRELLRIKYKIIEARKAGMLPVFFCTYVLNLGDDASKQDIYFCIFWCKQFMRVKGFYSAFPESAYELEKVFKNALAERSKT